MTQQTRICIYTKDVQNITGQSPRHARRTLAEIREKLGKEKHHYITTDEFAKHTGISIKKVVSLLEDKEVVYARNR